nr:type II toxin-antitoxin system RelE/ParE family toxin [Peptoniphilus senegalensis]
MKKYEVIVTDLAKKDIKNIHSYISNELFLPNEALNLVKLIEQNIKDLEVMPERFRKYEKYKNL